MNPTFDLASDTPDECFTPTKKNIAKGTTDPVHWELWLNQLFDQNFIACWSFRFELNVLIPHR